MLRPAVAIAAVLLASVTLPDLVAQDAGRAPLVGVVRTADGKPWANAQVTLWSAVHPAVDEGDELLATSDEHGRVQVQALPTRVYTVFATAVDGDRYRATRVANATVAAPFDLRAVNMRFPLPKLRLPGLDAWQARDLRWSVVTGGHRRPLAPPQGDVLALPPLPHDFDNELFAVTADGQPVLHHPLGAERDGTVTMPAPAPLLLRTLDGFGGKPVADAAVRLRFGPHAFVLGTTDADGYAEIDLAACHNLRGKVVDVERHLDVHASGRQLSTVWPADQEPCDAAARAALRSSGGYQLLATTLAGAPVRGRILLRAGEPAADLRLIVESGARLEHHKGAFSLPTIVRELRTDANGAFAIDDMGPHGNLRITALLDESHQSALDRPGGAPIDPLVPLFRGEIEAARDLDDLVLAAAPLHELSVREPDGAPAIGATLRLTDAASPNMKLRRTTDRSGRFAMRAAVGSDTLLGVQSAQGSLFGALAPAADAPNPTPIAIALRAWRRVSFVVRAADRADCRVGAVLLDVPMVKRKAPAAGVPGFRQPLSSFEVQRLLELLHPEPSVDAEGNGVLLLPDEPSRWQLQAHVQGERKASVQLEATSPPSTPIELRW